MAEELIFIPKVGFRSARALGTRANVVVERNGRTLIAAIAPDRDGTRVLFAVSDLEMDPGPDGQLLEEPARLRDDHGREVAQRPGWFTAGWIRRAGDGTATLRHTLILEPLAPDVRHVELAFGGADGDWLVRIPVEPVMVVGGTRGRPVDSSDIKRGVTLAARAVARSHEVTAIELEASFHPPAPDSEPARRTVRGIGPCWGTRLGGGDQLALHDDAGRVHLESGEALSEPTGSRRREVVMFPALPADVRSGVIEAPYVWVVEWTDEIVKVPVPGEADVSLADCDGHVVVSRVAGTDAPGSVRVEVTPHDLEADRQLVFIEGVEVAGRTPVGRQIERCVGKRPIVEVPDPMGSAREVTLRSPVVQLRGPWRLEFPLAYA